MHRPDMRFDVQRPECDTVMHSLWEYLDAELAPGAARIIGAHVDTCERCGAATLGSVALKRAVRRAGNAVRAPAALRERAATIAKQPTTDGEPPSGR